MTAKKRAILQVHLTDAGGAAVYQHAEISGDTPSDVVRAIVEDWLIDGQILGLDTFMSGVAEHLNSLAESDRDSGHVDDDLVRTLEQWVARGLPGGAELQRRLGELLALRDRVPVSEADPEDCLDADQEDR